MATVKFFFFGVNLFWRLSISPAICFKLLQWKYLQRIRGNNCLYCPLRRLPPRHPKTEMTTFYEGPVTSGFLTGNLVSACPLFVRVTLMTQSQAAKGALPLWTWWGIGGVCLTIASVEMVNVLCEWNPDVANKSWCGSSHSLVHSWLQESSWPGVRSCKQFCACLTNPVCWIRDQVRISQTSSRQCVAPLNKKQCASPSAGYCLLLVEEWSQSNTPWVKPCYELS